MLNSVLQLKKMPSNLPLMGEPWLPLLSFTDGSIRFSCASLQFGKERRRFSINKKEKHENIKNSYHENGNVVTW